MDMDGRMEGWNGPITGRGVGVRRFGLRIGFSRSNNRKDLGDVAPGQLDNRFRCDVESFANLFGRFEEA